MGNLSESEAVQIWSASQDHSNAILGRLKASDDMAQMKADMELERARQNLRAMIGQHIPQEAA